jgi:protein TonB
MEIKKTPKADLENKRLLFFFAGLAVSLCLFFAVMELKIDSDKSIFNTEKLLPPVIEQEFDGEDLINIIQQDFPEPQQEKEKPVYEDFNITDKTADKQKEQSPAASVELSEEHHNDRQGNQDNIAEETLKTEAEIMPQFPGGRAALARFLNRNIKYPDPAINQKKQGRVLCSFIVNGDGQVSDIKLENGTDILLDDEALRVLEIMPPWIPGEENGKKIRVKVYLPVFFKL